MTETALMIPASRELTPNMWQMLMEMAPVMHSSRLFGVSSKEQAAAIMLKGYELGLSITASFEFIQVIQGKPSLAPRGALALLLNRPEITKIEVRRLPIQGDPFIGYECFMARNNGFSHTARFLLEDAKRAGLIKSGSGWANYPENMCMWRAIGFCADVVAPDITAGMTAIMKMPEEFGVTLTQAGEIIDMPAPSITEQPEPAPVVTMDMLLEVFGAEAVIAANEGRIPGTAEEIAAVAAKLGV